MLRLGSDEGGRYHRGVSETNNLDELAREGESYVNDCEVCRAPQEADEEVERSTMLDLRL